MSSKPLPREEELTRYLLGALPDEEIERLDEQSIADHGFAARLTEAENELVDAYVRNELAGETLELFRAAYLTSARNRQKVEFARALAALAERKQPPARPWWRVSLAIPRWSLACAAAVLTLVIAWSLSDDFRLRRQASRSEVATAAKEKPAKFSAALTTLAVVLEPPTRGATTIPTVTMPASTGAVAFELRLEVNDFPAYRAALSASGARQPSWQSDRLTPHSSGERQAISVQVPASLLAPGNYVDVSGLGPVVEPMGSYAFRVAAK